MTLNGILETASCVLETISSAAACAVKVQHAANEYTRICNKNLQTEAKPGVCNAIIAISASYFCVATALIGNEEALKLGREILDQCYVIPAPDQRIDLPVYLDRRNH